MNTKATLRWEISASTSLPDDVRDRLLGKYPRRINKVGELVITSQRFRDQGRNVADCLEKLRELLATVATAPKSRKKTKPTRAARARRLSDKKATSEKKQRRRLPPRDDY